MIPAAAKLSARRLTLVVRSRCCLAASSAGCSWGCRPPETIRFWISWPRYARQARSGLQAGAPPSSSLRPERGRRSGRPRPPPGLAAAVDRDRQLEQPVVLGARQEADLGLVGEQELLGGWAEV